MPIYVGKVPNRWIELIADKALLIVAAVASIAFGLMIEVGLPKPWDRFLYFCATIVGAMYVFARANPLLKFYFTRAKWIMLFWAITLAPLVLLFLAFFYLFTPPDHPAFFFPLGTIVAVGIHLVLRTFAASLSINAMGAERGESKSADGPTKLEKR